MPLGHSARWPASSPALPTIERFDYSRIGHDWAVLRLLTGLGPELSAPWAAHLVVDPDGAGEDLVYAAARACGFERRLLTGRQGGSELLWRASFALPLDVVRAPEALFSVQAGNGFAVALPAPGVRIATPRALILSPRIRVAPRPAAGMRQRFAALATAVVVTATSTPAIALAAGEADATGSGKPSAGRSRAAIATAAIAGLNRKAPRGGTTATRPAVRPAKTAATKPAGASRKSRATKPAVRAAKRHPANPATHTAKPPATKPTTHTAQTVTTQPATHAAKTHLATTPAATTSVKAPAAATVPAPATAAARAAASTPVTSAGAAATGGAGAGSAAVTTTATGTGTPTTMSTTVPGTTAADTGASSSPQAPSISNRRLIGVRPRTAAASPAGHTPAKLTHLFSDPSRAAHHAASQAARVTPGCHTDPGAGVVAYAAGKANRSVRIACLAPGGTTARPAHTPAKLPTFPTTAPAAHHPAAKSHAAPARHSSAGSVARRRAAASHATGGAPLDAVPAPTSPATGSGSPLSASSPLGVAAPQSWTGTVSANPGLTGSVNNLSGLLSDANRPPSFLIPIYMAAGRRFNVPWEVLAAINSIESNYGQDLSTSSAGAVGWMQFEPSTWKQYGMAVDGHSVPNPYDPEDAIYSAARYLAAAGGAHNINTAVYAYNHAAWYVDEVMARAHAIASHAQFESSTVKHGTFSVAFATGSKRQPTIRYRSGVLSHYDRLIAAANMVSAANFPYLYGGGHEQPARFAPFDCSGSVSYVMQQAGYKVPTTVSGDIPIWKFPAGPGVVTIFYNPVHTFMRIGNRYFGTSGFARPGGGAGWFDVNKLPANYLSTFREVHVPGLGTNSFAPGEIVIIPPAPAHHTGTSGLKLTLLLSSLGPFPATKGRGLPA